MELETYQAPLPMLRYLSRIDIYILSTKSEHKIGISTNLQLSLSLYSVK